MTSSHAKLTPLGVMALALLREGDMHPYEMLRLLQQRHRDRILPLTKGALYHTVARLEQRGFIAEAGVDRDGNRPERTSYTLLDAGGAAVLEWVRAELSSPDRDGRFRVALAEAHNLPRDEVRELLAARRAAILAQLEGYRDGLANAREREVPEQFLLDSGREAVTLEAEAVWLDTLLARLNANDLPWGDDGHLASAHYQAQRKAARQ